MTKSDDNAPRLLSRGQFTLLGLLSFMLAWSLYFSDIAVMVKDVSEPRQLGLWLNILIFYGSWVVVALLFRSWRLRQALIVHCSGPVMAIVVCLLFFPGGTWDMIGRHLSVLQTVMRAIQGISATISLGCFVSLLVSLPIATLMLAYLVLTRKKAS